PWLLDNATRPLLGPASVLRASPDSQLFFNRPELRAPYEGAATFLAANGCRRLGLAIGGNEWEYPFWKLLGEPSAPALHISHVGVTNVTRAMDQDASAPCAIIAWGRAYPPAISWRGGRYAERWRSGPMQVFVAG